MEDKEKDLVAGGGIKPQATGNVADILKTHAERLNNYDPRIKNVETNKQDTLISSQNIKTINGQSLLGSGDIVIDAISTWVETTYSISGGSSAVITINDNLSNYTTLRFVGNPTNPNDTARISNISIDLNSDIKSFSMAVIATSGSANYSLDITPDIPNNKLNIYHVNIKFDWSNTKIYLTNIKEATK